MISSCHLQYELQANRILSQTYKFKTKTEIGIEKCLNYRLRDDRLFQNYQHFLLFWVSTIMPSLLTTLLIFTIFKSITSMFIDFINADLTYYIDLAVVLHTSHGIKYYFMGTMSA